MLLKNRAQVRRRRRKCCRALWLGVFLELGSNSIHILAQRKVPNVLMRGDEKDGQAQRDVVSHAGRTLGHMTV